MHQMSKSIFSSEILDFDNGGEHPKYGVLQKLNCFSKIIFKLCFGRDQMFFVHHRVFLVLALLAPRRFLFVCHNIFPDKNNIFKYMTKVKMVAVSEEVRGYLLSWNSKLSISVIPNGVETCPSEERKPIPDGVLRIGYVGRLEYQKGIDVLLNALLSLEDRRNLNLRIVGEGSLLSELKRLASTIPDEECIEFFGYTPRPWALLKNCDYIVVPSRYEGFGLVAYEAVARGHSIVMSGLDVFSHLSSKTYASFVRPGDVEDLAKCLSSLKKNGCRGRQALEEDVAPFITVGEMVEKYDELVSREFFY